VKDNPAISVDINQIFPFQLDAFQIQAIAALDAGKSVVVCAPTGSGKTVIGEYAIYRALSRGKRVFYTTPLKALSNQKFRDFQEQFDNLPIRFNRKPAAGLITGDILINPGAPVVVMTTEIFRNMLYETPIGEVGTSLEDVETVVLDECHYISDPQRGTVWEESIIYCPPTIQLVALSATIGNPEELTDWINQVRASAFGPENQNSNSCELIDSDFRPVPLRYYFINNTTFCPLLNSNQTKINSKLAQIKKAPQRKVKRQDCPNTFLVLRQLQEKEMLPAIYVIFSRKACDQAVRELNTLNLVNEQEGNEITLRIFEFFLWDDTELQEQMLEYFADEAVFRAKLTDFVAGNSEAEGQLIEYLGKNPQLKSRIIEFLAENSELARAGHLEPLTRGIAAHHAGILPVWKELVEKLFEQGLVKVVFATATLSAGINMPARTTVISALSKRTDEGHSMLTPSEFLQIAGRAGRRGKDKVGHVVTLQTPFEGAKEAAYLATSPPEPLKSCFTPSYGMVLNLLQKYTIEEAKDLLERSFAEYLAELRLAPEQQAIADLSTDLARIDIELAAVDVEQFNSYEKLRERLKEEYRLVEILKQQAETRRKKEVLSLLPQLSPGGILYLKGKHVTVNTPIGAVLVSFAPGSGQALDLLCLGCDNRWYVGANADVVDINPNPLPQDIIQKLPFPDIDKIKLGKSWKGNEETALIAQEVSKYLLPLAMAQEVMQQQQKAERLQKQLDNHPLQQFSNPGHLVKRHKQRLILRDQLNNSQLKYQRSKLRSSYYWDEFLNLIEILREFHALDAFTPTYLGETAATIRGENELWIALAINSGELDHLEPPHLAAAISALITETPRPDSDTMYPSPNKVLEALGFKKSENEARPKSNLREIRRQLYQSQSRYDISIPVWLESKFIGLVEQWARGADWYELCQNTSLDEGDIVRLLRRTVDTLWQIPQIPGVSEVLSDNAQEAVAAMKRFPI